MFMASIKRVLIIGGGVAGPVLATFLRKAGIDALVFEADPTPNQGGAGLGIATNGMRVLKAAGILPSVAGNSVRINKWCFENQYGKSLASIPEQAADPDLQPVAITRTALQKAAM